MLSVYPSANKAKYEREISCFSQHADNPPRFLDYLLRPEGHSGGRKQENDVSSFPFPGLKHYTAYV